MNRFFLFIIFIAFFTAFLSAGDFSLSAGGGIYLGSLFSRYTLTADGSIKGEPVSVNAGQEMNQFNFGAFLFADATWAEFDLGIQGGRHNYKETMVAASPSIDDLVTNSVGKGTEMMLSLALLGKYPFTLNGNFLLFPLLGLEYQIALMEIRQPDKRSQYDRTDPIRGDTDANGDTYKLSAWNSLFIVIGAGIDYKFTSLLFLRTELLYSFRLKTPYEADSLEKAKRGINATDPKLGGLTSGPTLKIAVGRKF